MGRNRDWSSTYGITESVAAKAYETIQDLRYEQPTRWEASLKNAKPRWWLYARAILDTGLAEDIAISMVDQCLKECQS